MHYETDKSSWYMPVAGATICNPLPEIFPLSSEGHRRTRPKDRPTTEVARALLRQCNISMGMGKLQGLAMEIEVGNREMMEAERRMQ
jgi:hypothetical protein